MQDTDIDEKLTILEEELDLLNHRSDKSGLVRRFYDTSEVDHARLMQKLVSNIPSRASIDDRTSSYDAGGAHSTAAFIKFDESSSPVFGRRLREYASEPSKGKEVERLRKRLADMDKEMVYLVKTNEEDVRAVQTELAKARGLVEQLQHQSDKMRKVIESLNARLKEDMDKVQMKKELDAMQVQNAELVAEVKLTQSEVLSRDQDIDVLKASIADLEKLRIKAEGEVSRYLAESQRLSEEIVWLKDQLRTHQSTAPAGDLKYEVEQLKYIVESQKRDINFFQKENRTAARPGTIRRRDSGVLTSHDKNLSIEVPVSPVIHSKPKPRDRSVSPHWATLPPWALHEEPQARHPPTPTTPKPRRQEDKAAGDTSRTSMNPLVVAVSPAVVVESTLSPKKSVSPRKPVQFTVPPDKLESELLALNLERRALESRLGKIPSYTGGRTLAERKEKYLKDRRLAEVDREIADLKSRIKERKKERSNPSG